MKEENKVKESAKTDASLNEYFGYLFQDGLILLKVYRYTDQDQESNLGHDGKSNPGGGGILYRVLITHILTERGGVVNEWY